MIWKLVYPIAFLRSLPERAALEARLPPPHQINIIIGICFDSNKPFPFVITSSLVWTEIYLCGYEGTLLINTYLQLQ